MLKDALHNTRTRLEDLAPKKKTRVRNSEGNKVVEIDDVERVEEEQRHKAMAEEARKRAQEAAYEVMEAMLMPP